MRNVRNEIFVALFVVIMMAVAIIFGVIVSNNVPESNDESATASAIFVGNSNVDSSDLTSPATIVAETETPTATSTVTEISATPINTETPTDEPLHTETSTLTATVEVIEDITPTDSVAQTTDVDDNETVTPEVTEEPTQVGAVIQRTRVTQQVVETEVTETSTPSATATLTPTNTPTATLTPTDTPTATVTPSATNTPTATNTVTPSVTPTLTRTIRPSENSPILPTLAPLPTEIGLVPTLTAVNNLTTINSAGCTQPTGWTVYVVQPRNTLFSIAQSVNSSVAELAEVNCLSNGNQIIAGDVLFVPRDPAGLVPVNTSGNGNGTRQVGVIGCEHPGVQIVSPRAGQVVSATFTIRGNALYDDQFGYYSLQIRSDASANYNFYSSSDVAVTNDVLGQIDSTLFSSGRYWVRLQIVDVSGNTPQDATCVIPIVID